MGRQLCEAQHASIVGNANTNLKVPEPTQALLVMDRNEKRGSRPLPRLNWTLLAEAFTYCDKNQPLLRYTSNMITPNHTKRQEGEK